MSSSLPLLLGLLGLLCLLVLLLLHKVLLGHEAAESERATGGQLTTAPLSKVQLANCSRRDSRVFMPSRTSSAATRLLYSFPGSGNTWLRLLLDHSTASYSGSVYSDANLYRILPGERRCDSTSVSVVKAHPHLQTFQHFATRDLPSKCALLNPTVSHLVFLIRNPYQAIWSEYQRRKSRGKHNRLIAKDYASWHSASAQEHWHKMSRNLAKKWVEQWSEVDKFQSNGTKVVTVYLEDLLGDDKEQVLSKIVDFIAVGAASASAITCAFKLAETPVAHRRSRVATGRAALRNTVSIEDAFRTKESVCSLWAILGAEAKARATLYSPYGNFTCN